LPSHGTHVVAVYNVPISEAADAGNVFDTADPASVGTVADLAVILSAANTAGILFCAVDGSSAVAVFNGTVVAVSADSRHLNLCLEEGIDHGDCPKNKKTRRRKCR